MGQKIKFVDVEDNKLKEAEKDINSLKSMIMFSVAFILTLFLIGIGSYNQGGQIVKVGDVALTIYVAPRDIVDQVATDKLREAAASSVVPMYKNDTVVEQRTLSQVNELFQELNSLVVTPSLNEIYDGQAGLNNENNIVVNKDLALSLPVVFTDKQLQIYVNLPFVERRDLEEATIDVLTQAYSSGVFAEALETGKANAYTSLKEKIINEDLQTIAYIVISAALEPNLVLDETAMTIEREQKRSEVADVLIRKNQKIVGEGEIIDQEIFDRLTALNLINVGGVKEESILPLIGNVLMTSLLFGFAILFIKGKGRQGNSEVALNYNEQKMLFWIYILMILLMRLISGTIYYTIIPLELFAMLVSALLGRKTALAFHSCCCIIGCIIFAGDIDFLIYSFVSGFFGAVLIQNTQKRSQTVPVALGMSCVNFVAIMGVNLLFKETYSSEILILACVGAVTGLVSVIVTMGSLPFWEEVFQANTPLYLLEFTNHNHELLRKMMIEAPATYHHSLIVANLAETATYAVGGNIALARAGAYYHDVGKLKSPMHFAENQSGYNPHDHLTPEESAKIITSHTTDGLALGEKYKLPKQITNIMIEHHGNSTVKYFYFKALKEYGGENVNEEDYRYKGRIPQCKESAIIMLADTAEAAVRAMLGNGKTLTEADEFIRTLIKDKLDDGQLNNSKLMIHELEIIKNAFMEVFHGMYHERVSYPKPEEIEKAKCEKVIEKEVKN